MSFGFVMQTFLEEFKEYVLLAERALLYTLGFDFHIVHPYRYLLETIHDFKLSEVNSQLPQLSWNFVNDR